MNPPRPHSAIPPVAVRAIGFFGILLAGLLGGLLGYLIVKIQCSGVCAVPSGIGILVGSVTVASGTAVIAVLMMRAVGEWNSPDNPTQRTPPPTTMP